MRAAIVVWAGMLLAGCGGDDLDDTENVKTWVNTGSALAVYVRAHDVVAFAEDQPSFADPMCPTATDDGTKATIAGGCTDSRSEQWVGSATLTRAADGSFTVRLDGYGHSTDPSMLAPVTGDFAFAPTATGTHTFTASYVQKGGMETTVAYSGSVEGGFHGKTTWNGTGTVDREGVLAPVGKVEVTTIAEVVDDAVCQGQPASGTTQVEADGHAALVTYDGATDCDDAANAKWSYDGEDRGTIAGISCSASPGEPGRAAWLFAPWLALAVVRVRQREASNRVKKGLIHDTMPRATRGG